MKAIFKKDVSGEFAGMAHLYQLDPPMKYSGWTGEEDRTVEFVIVSAINAYSGPETYIFEADESGSILDWSELPGSFRGGCNIPGALSGAGYTIS